MFTIEEMNEKLNKIHCMDCLEFMKQVPDKYFDLVLTDPPYGINVEHLKVALVVAVLGVRQKILVLKIGI